MCQSANRTVSLNVPQNNMLFIQVFSTPPRERRDTEGVETQRARETERKRGRQMKMCRIRESMCWFERSGKEHGESDGNR